MQPPPGNRIILGLMNFGPDTSKGGRITSLADFNKALDVLQARGYNEVDTARVYGDQKQEAFTAQTHWKERGLTLATKVMYPVKPGLNAAPLVEESVAASLADLETDCVDVCFCLFFLGYARMGLWGLMKRVDIVPARRGPRDTVL